MMPTIGIGLPVYNGGKYLREALDSVLAQTWTDFEVIICDNDSTDATATICFEYCAHDSRLRYVRNSDNIGAAANFNKAFLLSSAPFFKWMAHDDVLAPEFLETCMRALEADARAILACSAVSRIDEEGRAAGRYDFPMRVGSPRPHERFADLILIRHPCTLVFGVIRRQALSATRLIGPFTGSDRCLLAQLALIGRFAEVPRYLFYRRDHPETSCRQFDDPRARNAWFNPRRRGGIYLPEWRIMWEYLRIIHSSPLSPAAAIPCYLLVARAARERWRHLLFDFLLGSRELLQRSAPGNRLSLFCREKMRRVGFDPYALRQQRKPKSD